MSKTYLRIPDSQMIASLIGNGAQWYWVPDPCGEKDEARVCVRYSRTNPKGWTAKVLGACLEGVLGRYPTPIAALDAAELYLSVRNAPRLCNLRDIDLARKERAKITASPLPLSEQEGR